MDNTDSTLSHDLIVHNSTANWAHWQALGLTADLLPVVSDLTVPLSPTTQIKKLDGKTPTVIERGKARGLAGWPTRTTTANEASLWAADPRYSIGLVGRQVKAIDIDVDDPVLSGAIRDAIEMTLGTLPCRSRSNSGKCLLLFRMDEPMDKTRIAVTGGAVVELLGDRQQFLLEGMHKSGVRYEWLDGLPVAIPTLTPDDVAGLIDAIAETFGVEDAAASRGAYVPREPIVCDGDDIERDRVVAKWEGINNERADGRIEGLCPWGDGHSAGGAEFAMYIRAGYKGQGHSGYRCLHAHCDGRTIFDFLNKIGVTAEATVDEFPVVERQPGEPEPLPALERKRSGRIVAERNTLKVVLKRPDLCGMHLRFDTFTNRIMWAPVADPEGWRSFTETDRTALCLTLEDGPTGFEHIPNELAREMVRSPAGLNSFDSAQHWLGGLVWDGVPRVHTFICTYLRCEDTPYTRAVSAYLLTALAGRVIEPGVRADMVPVFCGPQGAGKSSVVAALAPSPAQFLELDFAKNDDNLLREMCGRLVIELGELRGMRTREQADLKQFISRQTDNWVPKFVEESRAYQRRSVFVGTTNVLEFLSDDTGNRRWLPVEVQGHQTQQAVAEAAARVAAVRDQLWAEGASMFRATGIAWLDAERLAKPEHSRFEAVEPWEQDIARWISDDGFDGPRDALPFTTEQVLRGAIGIELKQINDMHRKRVAGVLRRMGYADRRAMVNGARSTFWSRPS